MKKNSQLSQIAKYDNELYNILLSTPITGRFRLIPSQRVDRLPTILDSRTNLYYYNNYDPLIAAKIDIEKRNILLGNLVIFFGFGAGYHIIEYLNRFPYASVLVIENDPEIIRVAVENINIQNIFAYKNIKILTGISPVQMYPKVFDFLNQPHLLQFLSSINIIDNPIAVAVNKEFYVNALNIIREAITNVLGLYGNDPHDSLIGIQMTLRNLSIIVDNPGIKELEGIFAGKPGIVVSTGPSLNKNIHLLKGLENKAVIAAPDASVKVLKKHGIKPAHLVTSLERVIATSKLFEGLTEEDVKDSYLAACPVVVPETYANFPGEKIIVYRNFATFKWIDIPKGILDIGPSAGNMAFKVLEFLGCDPIILIGQDLAFTDDEKTHAEGAHYGEKSEGYLAAGIITVPGNYQPLVKTSQVFHQFLRHYERDIATYKGKVINATEGGAKIEGTTLSTFQEAISKYIDCDIDVLNKIRKNLKTTPEKIKTIQVQELLKKMHTANDFSNQVILKMGEGVEMCNNYVEFMKESNYILDDSNAKKSEELLNNIEKIREIFNDPKFYLILMHYVQSYYIKAAMDLNSYRFKLKPSVDLNKLLIEKYREYYSVLGALTSKINIEFVNAISDLEKYLEKHNKKN